MRHHEAVEVLLDQSSFELFQAREVIHRNSQISHVVNIESLLKKPLSACWRERCDGRSWYGRRRPPEPYRSPGQGSNQRKLPGSTSALPGCSADSPKRLLCRCY